MAELSAYEQRALAACAAQRGEKVAKAPLRRVPGTVQDVAGKAADRARKIPGASKAAAAAGKGYTSAAGGVLKALNRTTDITLSAPRVVRSFAKQKHDVAELSDIRRLDLAAVDRVGHFKRLRNSYAFAAAGEGAALGFLITGGTAMAAGGTVAGAGAGAAPGLGLIATASGTDTAAVLTLASHVVAHTSLYYGYDPSSPEEELFQMQVIGLGMATTQSAKAAAFTDLAQLANLLAKSAKWDQLTTSVFAKIVTKFASQVGQDLTKKKLGQLLPVAGVAIGAGLNFKLVDEIAESAYWAYRERFLLDKLGAADAAPPTSVPPANADNDVIDGEVVDGEVDEPILVLELLEEAKREEG